MTYPVSEIDGEIVLEPVAGPASEPVSQEFYSPDAPLRGIEVKAALGGRYGAATRVYRDNGRRLALALKHSDRTELATAAAGGDAGTTAATATGSVATLSAMGATASAQPASGSSATSATSRPGSASPTARRQRRARSQAAVSAPASATSVASRR